MEIKNFTPHEINVMGQDGKIIRQFPSKGIARCEVRREQTGKISLYPESIPINNTSFGDIYGLPKQEPDVLLIVSVIVANACKGIRDDVIIVDSAVRDKTGRIIGCRAFARV